VTWPRVNISTALESAAVFVDGDWVESKDQDPNGDVRLIQLADVGDGFYVDKSDRFLTAESARRLKCTFLESGDVLLARMPDPLGRACIFPGDRLRAITVVDVCVIRVDPGATDARWLMHCINAPLTRNQIAGYATGTTRSRISRGNLGKVEISLPPIPEQRRIAAILDQADALRAKRREALAQLDSLTQSIFIEMFGGQLSQDWPIETIADVAALHDGSIRTGPFGSQLLHSEFVAEGVAVMGIDNAVANEFRWGERRFINEAKYRELRRYTVRPGDVLITIMGTCGRCAVVPDGFPVAINTKHLCCITLNPVKCLPAFLHAFFLRHPMARSYLEQTSKGAIMSGLNMGLIKAMPISVPPLALQQTFATRIQAVESLKATHRAALAELDALFASLQHRAFAGQLL